ncbi:MAG: hypothetical protein JO258_11870 [Alphaproteobacteria bacterium]|nr:hypothetical protein [Alphaproteobacteria bacterium]
MPTKWCLTDRIVDHAADYLNGKTDRDMRRNKLVRLCQNFASLFKGS